MAKDSHILSTKNNSVFVIFMSLILNNCAQDAKTFWLKFTLVVALVVFYL